MQPKNLYNKQRIVDIPQAIIPIILEHQCDPGFQHRHQQFPLNPGRLQAISIVCSILIQQMTTFHRIQSLIGPFFLQFRSFVVSFRILH